MITHELLNKYFEENFFLIPLQSNSKIPMEKKWTEKRLTYRDAKLTVGLGGNIGIVGGYQSRKNEKDLIILDFDGRLGGNIHDSLEAYRNLNTYVQFTPKGFHVLLRINPVANFITDKVGTFCRKNNLVGLHRSTLNPKHEDNTFEKPMKKEEHDSYFLDSIRWSSMYIVATPSKVNGKSYWWLDDMKGEILEI